MGLLGCALGLGDDASLRALSEAIRVGIRCDRPGQILVDYHTVSDGVLSAEGKVKKTASTGKAETVVSQRSYLCDAAFLVAIQTMPDWVVRLAAAVQAPVWPLYLGRKCCLPARPVFEGICDYPSLEAALADWPRRSRNGGDSRLRAVVECLPGAGALRRDELISRHSRTFGPRYSREFWVEVVSALEEL